MDVSARFILSLLAGGIVVLIAWRVRSLTTSGALAAAAIGTAAAGAGPDWAVILILYFGSSAVVSRVGRVRKLARTAGMVAKPGARDAQQVLANGLVFGLAAVQQARGGPEQELWLLVAVGALAASAADTWATEIGTLVGGTPHSILTGRRLAIGASGGVTLAGWLASVAGAAFIAVLGIGTALDARVFPWIVAGGVTGALVDSLAGALVQRRQWCDACGCDTEMRTHGCGNPTRRIGGVPFIENDAVNLLATIAGAVATACLGQTFA